MQIILLAVSLLLGGLTLVTSLTNAVASEGHDHGDAPPATGGPAHPRFSASSDLFEVVGVLAGNRLTLYLDRFQDNSPVDGAKLEVEVGGRPIGASPRGVGEFEVMLDAPPPPGLLAVTVIIHAGAESDLLAGEFDIHQSHQESKGGASSWNRLQAVGTASLALLLLCLVAWAALRRRHVTQPAGAAL